MGGERCSADDIIGGVNAKPKVFEEEVCTELETIWEIFKWIT